MAPSTLEQRKLEIGISPFDKDLGGLPAGGLCLVCGGPDTGKTILGFNFLVSGLKNGERTAMISSVPAEDRLAQADHIGMSLRDFISTNQFIFLHQKTQVPDVIQGQQELAAMLGALEREILPWEPVRLVIDSGVPFIELFHPDFRRTGLVIALQKLSSLGLTTILTTRMPASSESMLLRKTIEEMAAASIHLDEQRTPEGETHRRFVVRKMTGIDPPYPVYEFDIKSSEGIHILDRTSTPLDSPKEEVKLQRKASERKPGFHFRKHVPIRAGDNPPPAPGVPAPAGPPKQNARPAADRRGGLRFRDHNQREDQEQDQPKDQEEAGQPSAAVKPAPLSTMSFRNMSAKKD